MCSEGQQRVVVESPGRERVIQQDIGDGFVRSRAPQRPETESCIGRFDHVPQRLGVGDPVGCQLNHARSTSGPVRAKAPAAMPGAAYCQHYRLRRRRSPHRRVARRSRRSGSSDPLPPGQSISSHPERRSRSAYSGIRPTGPPVENRETKASLVPFQPPFRHIRKSGIRYHGRPQEQVDIRHVGLIGEIFCERCSVIRSGSPISPRTPSGDSPPPSSDSSAHRG